MSEHRKSWAIWLFFFDVIPSVDIRREIVSKWLVNAILQIVFFSGNIKSKRKTYV